MNDDNDRFFVAFHKMLESESLKFRYAYDQIGYCNDGTAWGWNKFKEEWERLYKFDCPQGCAECPDLDDEETYETEDTFAEFTPDFIERELEEDETFMNNLDPSAFTSEQLSKAASLKSYFSDTNEEDE